MDRKELCEAVILSADEKKLLKEIYRHPHRKCEPEEIEALEEMGLVEEDAEKRPYFGVPIPLGAYCVSEFYLVVVSIITTLVVNALQ